MSGTIDPNTPLLVTLPARGWNALLSCAGEGLGALSAIIGEVQRQCMAASQRVPEPEPEVELMPTQARVRPNGDATPLR